MPPDLVKIRHSSLHWGWRLCTSLRNTGSNETVAETYVALLYSIGVAGNQRLIMADWRAMMEGLGFQNPRTLIATGNAIFESRRASVRNLEVQLEDAFQRRFGRRVSTSYVLLNRSAY